MARITYNSDQYILDKFRVRRQWNLIAYNQCAVCKDKFVREPFYSYIPPWMGHLGEIGYSLDLRDNHCTSCSPSLDHLIEWLRAKDLAYRQLRESSDKIKPGDE